MCFTGKYGFNKRHIVIMLDDGGDPLLQPTKANIVSHVRSLHLNAVLISSFRKLREIERLVQGVEEGDELVFYCKSSDTLFPRL